MGVEFNANQLKRRREMKKQFETDPNALVMLCKYDGSGRYWSSEEIKFFRTFWEERDYFPATYADNEGRKCWYVDFEGKWQYGLLYGILPKSNLHRNYLTATKSCLKCFLFSPPPPASHLNLKI